MSSDQVIVDQSGMPASFMPQGQTPMSGMGGMTPSISFIDREFAEFLVKDHETPIKMRDKWWGFLNVNVTLANISPEDMNVLRNKFEAARYTYLMSLEDGELTPDIVLEMDNFANLYYTKLTRGKEGFERKMIATQIVDHRTPQQSSRGFSLGRLFGRG